MRATVACLFVAAVVSLAAGLPEDARSNKKELAPLQGMWKLMSLEINGKAREFTDKAPRWVVRGDKVLYGGEELAGLTVDATTTPRSIDLGFRNPRRVYEGVYAIDGDTLKICVSRPDGDVRERPLDFSTEDKPGRRLLVFTRVKPGDGDANDGLTGFVGVAIQARQDPQQIVIMEVVDGGPAQKAGLKKDDVLLTVGGAAASDLWTVVEAIRQAKPGSELTVRVKRGDREKDIKIKVGFLPFTLLD
jgi:uncharacterized protein (TIGR03067 family)